MGISRVLSAVILTSTFAFASPVMAGDVYEIDQISDLSASTPEQFYRFQPNYYWIKLGDSVRLIPRGF